MLSVLFLMATTSKPRPPQRFGSVLGLKGEKLDEYKMLHAAVWPTVAGAIRSVNTRNYSGCLRQMPDGNHYLFSYLEDTRSDLAGHRRKLAANPEVKKWWSLTDPRQQPLADRKEGEWWASMQEVFHQE